MESAVDVDAFASPDTVCKYCGEDFKFFRALKHHLRSQHSSCRSKPYVCRLCTTGFSTKASCVRHIQKQHGDVAQSQLEDCIRVNEMLVQESREEAPESEDGGGRSACSSPGPGGAPAPPPAHSSPLGRFSTHSSPTASYTFSPPDVREAFVNGDQPLDFSLKSAQNSPIPAHYHNGYPLTPNSAYSGDEPMDLSTHSRSSSSCESSPAPGALRTRGPGKHFQPSAYSLQLSANVSNPTATTSDYMSELLASSGALVHPRYPTPALPGFDRGMTHVTSPAADTPTPSSGSDSNTGLALGDGLCNPGNVVGGADVTTGVGSDAMMRAQWCHLAAWMQHAASRRFTTSTGALDSGILRYKREYQKFYNPFVGRLECPFCKMLFKHGLKVCTPFHWFAYFSSSYSLRARLLTSSAFVMYTYFTFTLDSSVWAQNVEKQTAYFAPSPVIFLSK